MKRGALCVAVVFVASAAIYLNATDRQRKEQRILTRFLQIPLEDRALDCINSGKPYWLSVGGLFPPTAKLELMKDGKKLPSVAIPGVGDFEGKVASGPLYEQAWTYAERFNGLIANALEK